MDDSASLRSDAARNTRSLSPALSVISLSIGALTRLILQRRWYSKATLIFAPIIGLPISLHGSSRTSSSLRLTPTGDPSGPQKSQQPPRWQRSSGSASTTSVNALTSSLQATLTFSQILSGRIGRSSSSNNTRRLTGDGESNGWPRFSFDWIEESRDSAGQDAGESQVGAT